jgi:hypothetical protein
MLATVLFTDIVGSTEKVAELGDSRRRNLLDNHHAVIKRNLSRFCDVGLRRGRRHCDSSQGKSKYNTPKWTEP